MTPEQQPVEAASPDPFESFSLAQKENATTGGRQDCYGGRPTGGTADKMIELLKSRMTVSELLDNLATRAGAIA